MRTIMALACAVWVAGGCGSSEEPDKTPPGIASLSPADGAQNVARDAPARIVFSEAIDRNTLDSSLFHFVIEGQNYYGSVSYDLASFAATLIKTGGFAPGASVQAVLEPGVRDLAGNRMSQPVVWSFSVAP